MHIKIRYFWQEQWHYIDSIKHNLAIVFNEYENRPKTSRLKLWTCILDKSDKEIYEGNIIKNRFNEVFEVVFDNGCFYGAGKKGYVLETKYWKNQNVIIIGNTIENPELLK